MRINHHTLLLSLPRPLFLTPLRHHVSTCCTKDGVFFRHREASLPCGCWYFDYLPYTEVRREALRGVTGTLQFRCQDSPCACVPCTTSLLWLSSWHTMCLIFLFFHWWWHIFRLIVYKTTGWRLMSDSYQDLSSTTADKVSASWRQQVWIPDRACNFSDIPVKLWWGLSEPLWYYH